MTTIQHTAIFVLALAEKHRLNKNSNRTVKRAFYEELKQEIPWLLLPDAIRAYVKHRQQSHFEQFSNDHSHSYWMIFPDEETLKILSKDNVMRKVEFSSTKNFPNCVIGEETVLEHFDILHWNHPHRIALRCHLIQDCHLDSCLRQNIVDVTERFNDHFTIYHSGICINGQELRNQIALFEKFGFLKLVEAIYKKTGILLNKEWFDKYVLESLSKAYPEDLCSTTYKFMSIDDTLNYRISTLNFTITDEEKDSVTIIDDLEYCLNQLYAYALIDTYNQL